ncbi:SHOCT domain-containing protein [Haloarcula salinisoli]|uniref:SHOCT domain-containing protein n=1 Tax=Haloarcula salinisoli TaxID=2487746 RepID=A0A8J8CBM5_9EURY|nr:SHOCT domain-containing protein [Halomicroarcula salinisoli]MBX0287207.1 SHOCT domain-containing protein [Halomicroarcula salinisoli]MBX0304513.1 SHOCT domain-containing protein [Halomicroarcula salinisoli]
MVEDEDEDLEIVVAARVTTLTLAVAFVLMFAGVPWFWVAFPVGFGGVLPTALGATRLYQRRHPADSRPTTDEDDALATLRERYARGELTEAEFERQVERLLETEDVRTARERPSGETQRERETE